MERKVGGGEKGDVASPLPDTPKTGLSHKHCWPQEDGKRDTKKEHQHRMWNKTNTSTDQLSNRKKNQTQGAALLLHAATKTLSGTDASLKKDMSSCLTMQNRPARYLVPRWRGKNNWRCTPGPRELCDKETWKQKHNTDVPKAASESVASNVSKVEITVILRDLKIWYHYKTVDRRICVANFLELPDEKGSLTEGKGRTTFSTSGSMGVPSEAWCSRWVHTETLPTVAEHMHSPEHLVFTPRKEKQKQPTSIALGLATTETG
ncbi:hypothetical protein Anapl_13245 [Anas platyrhynchos]|uniref:Uncharacterized protein n=1 Tax=Anas platyrhynchos TaxID=8839 RepID=R0LXS9_ANAPL|nr:hypothetical protein Anapl_13245 [Anas platyrhynchos]